MSELYKGFLTSMETEIEKHVLKTGTLTIGLVCKDGLVVAADRRQSYAGQGGGVSYLAGSAKKIQEVNPSLIVTTAGNASDTRKTTDIIRAELKLKELKTRSKSTVQEAANLLSNMVFRNIRTPSMIPSISHFLIAGYDDLGIHIYEISPDGYIQEVDTYSATGSGIMQAHPILDAEYSKNMTLDEGAKLAFKCVKAAMTREPGVGAGIDVYIVKKGEIKPILAQEVAYEFKDKEAK